MANNDPSRETIIPQVCEVLARTSKLFGIPRTAAEIAANENWSLRNDLGLILSIREALSTPYSKITSRYTNGIRVTRNDSGNARSVKTAISLVHKRANGDKS